MRRRLLCSVTDASELAVSAILEQQDESCAFYPVTFESRKLTQPEPERSYPPHLLALLRLAVVHAFKTLRPYLLDKPEPAVITAAAALETPPGAVAEPACRVPVPGCAHPWPDQP
jgi:hypothetical protein